MGTFDGTRCTFMHWWASLSCGARNRLRSCRLLATRPSSARFSRGSRRQADDGSNAAQLTDSVLATTEMHGCATRTPLLRLSAR
jgi:hypothetical protein